MRESSLPLGSVVEGWARDGPRELCSVLPPMYRMCAAQTRTEGPAVSAAARLPVVPAASVPGGWAVPQCVGESAGGGRWVKYGPGP